jgi:Fur family ferric uptake transcriptional regulator
MPKISLKDQLVQMLEEKHLLSVSEFLDLLKKKGKTYNKTSVYRALEQLLEKEVVCMHYFTTAEASYELRDHHHDHLVCTNCGTVSAGECSFEEPKNVGSFKVNHHHTTLFGVCGDCQ